MSEWKLESDIPCNENRNCKYFLSDLGCHASRHHIYFPKRDYTTKTERKFINLPDNIVTVCRAVHDEFHAQATPPIKPSRIEMEEML